MPRVQESIGRRRYSARREGIFSTDEGGREHALIRERYAAPGQVMRSEYLFERFHRHVGVDAGGDIGILLRPGLGFRQRSELGDHR